MTEQICEIIRSETVRKLLTWSLAFMKHLLRENILYRMIFLIKLYLITSDQNSLLNYS